MKRRVAQVRELVRTADVAEGRRILNNEFRRSARKKIWNYKAQHFIDRFESVALVEQRHRDRRDQFIAAGVLIFSSIQAATTVAELLVIFDANVVDLD